MRAPLPCRCDLGRMMRKSPRSRPVGSTPQTLAPACGPRHHFLCETLQTGDAAAGHTVRSEEHTSELQSLMRISYAVFCLKKKTKQHKDKSKDKTTKIHTTDRNQI